jgi:ubiquinone/menaquinone biosynthesis C-methylase UbiE
MSEQARAVVAHYDERAATYDASEMHRRLTEEVARFVGQPGDVVLDVATGTGLMLRSLHGRYGAARMVGVDLSPRMLAVARAALPEARLVVGDAARLPVPDDSADLVTCITALHLFADPDAAIAEWSRVLRPGGRAVTATFRPHTSPAPSGSQRDFERRHADFADAGLVARAVAPYGFSLASHRDWLHDHDGQGGDRLLICELHC